MAGGVSLYRRIGQSPFVAYQPIESYGLIGDMQTAALVGTSGSIDWLCFPNFDSPSVFAAILDDEKGGRFEITPRAADFRAKQLYWPDTNVLVTRFLLESGVAEVVDYMPVGPMARRYDRRTVIRHVRSIRGKVELRMWDPLESTCRHASLSIL